MKEIRVGLLGCGYMGGMHLACYSAMANVRVAAVADAPSRQTPVTSPSSPPS